MPYLLVAPSSGISLVFYQLELEGIASRVKDKEPKSFLKGLFKIFPLTRLGISFVPSILSIISCQINLYL